MHFSKSGSPCDWSGKQRYEDAIEFVETLASRDQTYLWADRACPAVPHSKSANFEQQGLTLMFGFSPNVAQEHECCAPEADQVDDKREPMARIEDRLCI